MVLASEALESLWKSNRRLSHSLTQSSLLRSLPLNTNLLFARSAIRLACLPVPEQTNIEKSLAVPAEAGLAAARPAEKAEQTGRLHGHSPSVAQI